MEPQTVNLALSTSGVVPVSVVAYNANTLILSCEGDLSNGTFEELVAEIYQNANLGEDPLATVTYVGTLGSGPHLLSFTPEQTNLLPSAPSILSRTFYLVVRGTGTGGIKTVFVLGRLTLQANPASDIGAPPPAPSLYASNVFRYVAAAGSTSITASGRDDTLTFSVLGAGTVSLNPTTKTVSVRVYGGAAWQSGVAYALDTVVGNDGNAYLCTAAHTSALATEPGTGASWETVWKLSSAAASGDVTGPASSTDNAIVRFDGTTGKVIQNSGASVSDAGAVSTDALVLAQTPTTALSAGVMRYDSGEKVPEVGIETVTLKLGVQQYVRVYNDTALTMTRGQVVYISGAQGNRVAVRLASAASESTSAGTLGLVSQTIAAGAEGFVQVQGPMYNLDTSLLTAGALMFLSSTAGTLTATEPPAPQHGVRVAYVERVHATVGSLFIKVDNGYELGELHNVTDSLSGQVAVLVKNASTNVWESKTAAQTLTLIGAYPSSNPSNFSANSTDAYLLSRTNHTGTQATSTITGLDTALSAKADLVGGKLDTAQLPDLAISQYLGTVANQAAMLALVGQRGDWAIRSDDGKVYIVTAEPSSSIGNWTSLSYPTAPVLSVAGKTGTVTLVAADISNSTATGQSLMTAANSAAATAVLDTFTTSVKGLAPASGGGTTNFLRADGTWAAPAGGSGGTPGGATGELQYNNAGAFESVTNSSVSGSTITLGNAEAIGAGITPYLTLRNTTASTAVLNQNSPAIAWLGAGWASTPAESRVTEWRSYSLNASGAADPTSQLAFQGRVSGGAWQTILRLQVGANGNYISGSGVAAEFGATSITACNVLSVAQLNSSVTGLRLRSDYNVSWSNSTTVPGSPDLYIRRRAANNLQLGVSDTSVISAQTISINSGTVADSSLASVSFTLDSSRGCGSGVGGELIARTAPASAGGSSTQNQLVETLRIRPGQGIAVANSGLISATSRDSLSRTTVLHAVSVGSAASVPLSESWGVKWTTGTFYGTGVRVYNKQGSYVSQPHTSGATTEPGVGPNWTSVWTLVTRPGMSIPTDTVGQALILITGTSTAGDVARYMRQVSYKNVAGTSSLVGAVTTVGADVTATTSISVTVSDGTDSLEVNCTGVSGQTWRWQAVIFAQELAIGS
jgi:hypothetical protein